MVKVIRNEYPELPNGAKYFYEHLAECDFADTITKVCKGYVFRKVERLARECQCGESTVYRYLSLLKKARLVRVKRCGDIPYIFLLDMPAEKLSTYDNEAKFSKTQELYNKNLLTNRKIIANVQNVDFIFNAQEYACYERLLSWGYHPTQAIRDITNPEIGVGKIEQRLNDLHTLLRTGWTPRQSVASWLNWAIRSQEQIATRLVPPFPSADRPASCKLRDMAEYELCRDENGYEYYRQKPTITSADKPFDGAPPQESNAYVADNRRVTDAPRREDGHLDRFLPLEPDSSMGIVNKSTHKMAHLDYQICAMIEYDICYCPHSNYTPFLEGTYLQTHASLPHPAASFRPFCASLKILTFSLTALLNFITLHFDREGQDYGREHRRRGAAGDG